MTIARLHGRLKRRAERKAKNEKHTIEENFRRKRAKVSVY